MDFSGIMPWLMNMLFTPLMWLVLLIVFVVGFWIILVIRKRRRLIYPVAELVDLGQNKVNINVDLKAGYFGKTSYLGGLFWSGEQVVKTQYGDVIEYFSSEDFQEVNGERGIICYRDPIRRNVLIPINKINYANKELVASIAPADYTDVATKIVIDSAAEVNDWKDKIIQFAGWALVVIFALVAIIVIVQMVKNGQDKSAELLLNAGSKGAEACRNVCKDALSTVLSGTKSAINVGGAP